jgi:uncharacterized protein YceK
MRVALYAFLCSASGCMSILTQTDYWCGPPTPKPERVMLYMGTREHIDSFPYLSFTEGHTIQHNAFFVIIDLPLCLVMDTVLIPLTIYESIAGPRSSVPPTETAPQSSPRVSSAGGR